jgi:hypothetical protein
MSTARKPPSITVLPFEFPLHMTLAIGPSYGFGWLMMAKPWMSPA